MILTDIQNICFPKNNMGLSMKKYTIHFCADQIDVITNFAVITNVVHCTPIFFIFIRLLITEVQIKRNP